MTITYQNATAYEMKLIFDGLTASEITLTCNGTGRKCQIPNTCLCATPTEITLICHGVTATVIHTEVIFTCNGAT